MEHRHLYAGLIRLHILHHAAHQSIYGLEMIEELARHGYKMSAGTLYPLLHGLEERGLLTASLEKVGRSRRRVYWATPSGEKALAAAKLKVRELFSELFEDHEAALPNRSGKHSPAQAAKSDGPQPPGRRRPVAKGA